MHELQAFCVGATLGLAAMLGACGPPRCPKGYDQVGDTCYHHKTDAGSDGSVVDVADAGDAQPVETDAGSSVGDAQVDATSDQSDAEGEASPETCGDECGEHEVCKRVEDQAVCMCAPSYSTCDAGCADLMQDAQNCGSCGYACESGLACKQGQCEQRIRQLVLGSKNTCALFNAPDGRYPVKCWGDTALFRDSATEALTPRSIVGLPAVRSIAIGSHSCAVLADRDAVRCWGACDAACGNSGASVVGPTFFDVAVPAVADVYVNSATCAHTALDTVSCWGDPVIIGSETPRSSPQRITVAGETVLSEVSLGAGYGCAVAGSGRAVCWGGPGDKLGAVVDGTTAKAGVVVLKENGGELGHVVHVRASVVHSCAVTTSGELWCWGYNETAEIGPVAIGALLGVGDQLAHIGAVQVELSNVVDVAFDRLHTCAVVRSGQTFCWGQFSLAGQGPGALGDAAAGRLVTLPRPVPGLDDITEIQAGDTYTCARRRSGQVVCWGANDSGQLGDGTTVSRFSPTPVVGLY